jgi:hypothetical protein
MSKTATLALCAWAAALSSVAGLVYALHRPLVPPPSTLPDADLTVPTRSFPDDSRPLDLRPQTEIVLTPIRITARPPTYRAAVRDLEQMRCTAWRAVSQGPAGREVRYCE